MSHTSQMINKLIHDIRGLQLIFSLLPGKYGVSNKEVREALIIASKFVEKADKTHTKQGNQLIEILQKGITKFEQEGYFKINPNDLAIEFDTYSQKNTECYRYGVEFGWLNKLIDCSKLGISSDLPYHARIGIGHHAGTISVEEIFLLRDSFFLLLKAEETYNELYSQMRKWKDVKDWEKGRISEI